MTPILEVKVDKAITLAMARSLARHYKAKNINKGLQSDEDRFSTTTLNAAKAILPQTTAAWHSIVVKLLSGGAAEPRDNVKLDIITVQQLHSLTQLYEAVGAISTFWQCRHADQPWTDEELYMPTLKFTQQQFQH